MCDEGSGEWAPERADFYGFWGGKDFYRNYTPYHQYTLQSFFTRNSVNFQGSLQEVQSLPCQIPIIFIKNPVKFKEFLLELQSLP